MAKRLSAYDQLIFICGRYEGVDERIAEHYADEEIRIGDYAYAARAGIRAFVLIPDPLWHRVELYGDPAAAPEAAWDLRLRPPPSAKSDG